MSIEFIAAFTFLACVVVALIAAQVRSAREDSTIQDVIARGVATQGRVVAINRPILSRHEVHVYFSFDVPGQGSALQSCCIDLRRLHERAILYPSVGSKVNVLYLAQEPYPAVVRQLIPCLTGESTRAGARYEARDTASVA